MSALESIPETSAAQGLSHCNRCGVCCRISPCLLVPADVSRIATRLGLSAREFAHRHLRVERTPAGKWLVRMQSPCHFLVGKECSIQEFKPKGGADFECWNGETERLTYYWPEKFLKMFGALEREPLAS